MKKIIGIFFILNFLFLSVIPVFAKCKVEYRGKAKGLIAVPDNFFSKFDLMMPGDIKEEVVTIKNTENQSVEFYFQTNLEDDLKQLFGIVKEPKTERERSAVLLERVILNIWLYKEGKEIIIYKGDLAATALEKGISLGEYHSGEEAELRFQIEIPKELGNIYASSSTEVIWTFSVQDSSDSNSSSNPTSSSANIDKRESSDAVILGISNYSWVLGSVFVIGGILGGIWLVFRRKR